MAPPESVEEKKTAFACMNNQSTNTWTYWSFLREGRVVGLCWANYNLKDLKVPNLPRNPLLGFLIPGHNSWFGHISPQIRTRVYETVGPRVLR